MRKKLFLIFFAFLFINGFNHLTADEIIEHYTPIDYSKKSGSDDSGGGGGSGDPGIEDSPEAKAAAQAAKEAEQKLAQAAKAEEKAKNKLANLQRQYEDAKKKCSIRDLIIGVMVGDNDSYNKVAKANNLKEQVAAQKKILAQETKSRQEAAEGFSLSLKKLGDVYRALGHTGDPVQVNTGNYSYNAEIFTAQDFLKIFGVSLVYSPTSASIAGKNWISSLDSRIIRCTEADLQGYKNLLEEVLEINGQMLEIINTYDKENPIKQGVFDEEKKVLLEEKEFYEGELEYCNEVIELNQKLAEKNKYTAYGNYKNQNSHTLGSEYIIYIDENGSSTICCWNGRDSYVPVTALSAADFTIQLSDKDTENEKFCVLSGSGFKRYFNRYGILETEVDLNGNSIIYKNTDGLITEIINKTGEIFKLTYNGEKLLIKIQGTVSGTTLLSYKNGFLSSFTDNSENFRGFEYDNDGDLVKIKKADGSCISINYEYYSSYNKKNVDSVTNENNLTERFSYDPETKTVVRTTYEGKKEIHTLNDNNFIIRHENKDGQIKEFKVDELGLIREIDDFYGKRTIEYDEYFRPAVNTFEGGYSDSYRYNNYGQIVYEKDRDNFYNEYSYDKNGNLTGKYFCGKQISALTYYSNGLVKSISDEEKLCEYTYNSFGSITKAKTKVKKSKDSFQEEWTYDSRNRICQYKNPQGKTTVIKYSDKGYEENYPNGLKIQKSFDALGRQVSEIQTDTVTNKTFSKKNVYDSRSKVKAVYLDNRLYAEYEYTPEEKLKKMVLHGTGGNKTNDESIEWFYDSSGRNIGNSQNDGLLSWRQPDSGGTEAVVHGSKGQYIYKINQKGKLYEITRPDGSWEKRTYSPAGRLLTIEKSDESKTSFDYKNDGKCLVKKISKNDMNIWATETYLYAADKTLSEYTDSNGDLYHFVFDYKGNLLQKYCDFYNNFYSYDRNGRLIEEKITDKKTDQTLLHRVVTYSADSRKKVTGYGEGKDKIFVSEILDAWGNVVERTFGDKKSTYIYDCYGLCIGEESKDKTRTDYLYTPSGQISGISYNGMLSRDFIYSKNGLLSQVLENGKLYLGYDYDEDGQIIYVTDRFENKTAFLAEADSDVSGKIIAGTYETYETYESEAPESIERNAYGAVTGLKGSFGEFVYSYNSTGRLTKASDESSGLNLEYEYDAAGRCVSRKGPFFEVSYEYGSDGKISRLFEKKTGLEVNFEYDSLGRETKRVYSNQVQVLTAYDELGRTESVVSKTPYGVVFDAKVYFYDEKGRLKITADENGKIRRLTYDKDGKLICCEYDYEKTAAGFTDSGISSGFYVKDSNPSGTLLELGYEEAEKINQRLHKAGINKNADMHQYCWKEEYSYNESGGLIREKNPLGTIVYEYDGKNRLVSKHGSNSKTQGVSYSWLDDGCLESIISPSMKIFFTYGKIKRPDKIRYENILTGETEEFYYEYDVLGRRISERSASGMNKRIFYDGLTDNVVMEVPLYSSNTAVTSYTQIYAHVLPKLNLDYFKKAYKVV